MKHIFSYHFKQKQQRFSISCYCVYDLSPPKTATEYLINMRNPRLEVFISDTHLLLGPHHVAGLAYHHLRLKLWTFSTASTDAMQLVNN